MGTKGEHKPERDMHQITLDEMLAAVDDVDVQLASSTSEEGHVKRLNFRPAAMFPYLITWKVADKEGKKWVKEGEKRVKSAIGAVEEYNRHLP